MFWRSREKSGYKSICQIPLFTTPPPKKSVPTPSPPLPFKICAVFLPFLSVFLLAEIRSPPGLVHAYLYIFRRFFGHQKGIFWKQSPWWRVFENARLWFKGESFLSPEPLGFVTDQETTGSGDENGYERTRIC